MPFVKVFYLGLRANFSYQLGMPERTSKESLSDDTCYDLAVLKVLKLYVQILLP